MDERMKHRAIGFVVLIAVMLIIAPVVIKSTEPVWHTLHRRGEFSIPKESVRQPIVEAKHERVEWQAPKPVTTVNIDNKPTLSLHLKPVARLPLKTRVESLPTVSAVRLVNAPHKKARIAKVKPVQGHQSKPVVTIKPLQLKKTSVSKSRTPSQQQRKSVVHSAYKQPNTLAKPRLIRVISAKSTRQMGAATKKPLVKAARVNQPYHVQVAMMSSKQNADKLKARLQALKYKVEIKPILLKSKRTLYLVKLVNGFSKEGAIRAQTVISQQLHIKSLVRRS